MKRFSRSNMCIEPPRPFETPSTRPKSSAMTPLGSVPAHERVAVRAVGRDQVVVVAHRARRADDRRLLADREVQEAADLGLGVHLSRALLEAADEHHRLQPFAGYVALWKGVFGHRVQDVSAGSPRVPRGSTLLTPVTKAGRPGRPRR
jgi:hypothetical protein